jgi:hypothetical protein
LFSTVTRFAALEDSPDWIRERHRPFSAQLRPANTATEFAQHSRLEIEMAKTKAVFGVYKSRNQLGPAIIGYEDAGFSSADVSVLLLNLDASDQTRAAENEFRAPQSSTSSERSRTSIECAPDRFPGAAFEVRGVGPVTALGPLVASLLEAGESGASRRFIGSLTALGVSEVEAHHYQKRLLQGGIVVAIHCDTAEEIRRAKEIMEITRAEDITSPGAEFSEHEPGGRKTAA